ncbi:MAG TPA: glycosyltransferase family 2 protein [Kiritimatiellia bacterium]|nr:glycosyltransferase family 2 protein [Kiritimatiellia bacterium]HMO99815.1 glycosyltransferase family 2 protein [Kiritimatiellia bacterium]HMP97455.1 glycosyltransferase family 2 protein [Kiritimatiellia bacterium]
MSALPILFWFCVAGVFYIYAGYPLLVGLCARLVPKPVQKAPNTFSATIIISIHNEAPRLAAKLRNILAGNGSDRIVQLLIGSDGCTDHPEIALRELNDPRIHLVACPERRGKPSMLNDLIPQATGDILIMMDVRQRLDEQALTALLDNFSDPSVGVVSGELVFERDASDTAAAGGIDAYWRYEKWIRDREARFGSVPGATGALYAIRRERTRPIPADAALDDVLLPMLAIAQGVRCVFEPAARIYDRPAQDAHREAIRKRRTLAGNVQLLRYHPLWCLPGGHPIWWQFASHKIARLFSPFLLVGALATSLALAAHPLFLAFALAQIAAWSLAMLHRWNIGPRSGSLGRLAGWLSVFLIMQVNILLAWWDGLTARNLARWKKAEAG